MITVQSAIGGSGVTSGTVIATTSGTAHNFTGIPAGTKLIIVSFSGVSTTAVASLLMRLGTGGVLETTGYVSIRGQIDGTTALIVVLATSISLFGLNATADTVHGTITLSLLNAATNLWSFSGNLGSDTGATNEVMFISGSKALAGQLDMISIYTSGTFDGGSVNILYQ